MITERLESHEKIPLLNTDLRPGPSYASHVYPIDRYLKKGDQHLNLSKVWEKYDFKPRLNDREGQALTELQAILKSTTEELKEISKQLTESHEINLKPRGFSQKYNQYTHVENIVKSKLYNTKRINRNDKVLPFKEAVEVVRSNISAVAKNASNKKNVPTNNKKKSSDASVQANLSSTSERKPRTPKSFPILDSNNKKVKKPASVGYDHIKSRSMEEKSVTSNNLVKSKNLVVQNMPSISIRHELKEQKLPSLHISPDMKQQSEDMSNVKFVNLHFNQSTFATELSAKEEKKCDQKEEIVGSIVDMYKSALYETNTQVVDKVLKTISKTQKRVKCTAKKPRHNATSKPLRVRSIKRKDEVKKDFKSDRNKIFLNTKSVKVPEIRTPESSTEYIPYTQLTLGGVSAEDLEKEIDSVDNKSDVLLSPIVHRILGSKTEEDPHETSKAKTKSDSKDILSKSDEVMLKEMIDLDNKIQKTLLADVISPSDMELSNDTISPNLTISESKSKATETYADDFEEICDHESSQNNDENVSKNEDRINKLIVDEKLNENIGIDDHQKDLITNEKMGNKMSKLSLKSKIEIFEFLPPVDKINESSQSQTCTAQRETQTSPPNTDCEKISTPKQSEKLDVLRLGDRDIIKYLIKEECENILDNKNYLMANNVSTVQKYTQTSYNDEKSLAIVPTSTLDKQSSPISFDASFSKLSGKVPIEGAECGLSLNSSSPRFQLQLPSSCLEYFSKLDTSSSTSPISKKTDGSKKFKYLTFRKQVAKSTSSNKKSHTSTDSYDTTLSDSLGQVNIGGIHRKKYLMRKKLFIKSDTSSKMSATSPDRSTDSNTPAGARKSEGELSMGQILTRR